MCWVWLFLAILLEVAATVFMKLSDGFSKMLPTFVMTLLYGLSFIPLALALKRMEVGTAYAIWSAVGTAMVTTVGVLLFNETVSPLKVISIGLIIVGVVFLNLATGTEKRLPHEARNQVVSSQTFAESVDEAALTSLSPRQTSEAKPLATGVTSPR